MKTAAKTALVVAAAGSESLEIVTMVNLLRRAGVAVTLATLDDSRLIAGSRDITLTADASFEQVAAINYDLIALPGGETGAMALSAHAPLIEKLHGQRLAHRWIAALCVAPAIVLGRHGLLDGKQATGFPSFRDELLHYVDLPVVTDGHTITGQGPSNAIAFGLALVEALLGSQVRQRIARDLLAE